MAAFEAITATCKITVEPIHVTNIQLSQTSVSIMVSDWQQLKATVYPQNATDQSINWVSSDENIATVDKDGYVRAKAVGNASITASCDGHQAKCQVTVIPKMAESVSLNQHYSQLKVGGTLQLQAKVKPDATADKSIVWSSKNPNIATVDKNGLVSALALGETDITAKCGAAYAICTVEVVKTQVEEIRLDKAEITLNGNEQVQLVATVLPENASVKTITWKSEDEDIAQVDDSGIVSPTYKGQSSAQTAVTASSGDASASCIVIVKPVKATSVILNKTSVVLKVSESIQLTANVLPENANNKAIIWGCADENIANVDQTGKITAVSEGQTYLVATCGDVMEFCTIIVSNDVIPEPTELNYVYNGNNFTAMVSFNSKAKGKVCIPSKVLHNHKTYTVTSICQSAFEDCAELYEVVFPNTLISIGKSAFDGCTGLKDFEIPNSVKSIDQYAFFGCLGPESLTIPDLITRIQTGTFYNCSNLKKLTIGSGVTSIYEHAFNGCQELQSVTCLSSQPPIIYESTFMNRANTTLYVDAKYLDLYKSAQYWSDFQPILPIPGTEIKPASISLDKSEVSLVIAESSTIIAKILPKIATDKIVTWKSNDESIATVDANGKVTGVSIGKTIITATTANGLSATCKITVSYSDATDIVVAEGSDLGDIFADGLELLVDESKKVGFTVVPSTASPEIIFSSNDENVAIADESGNITALAEGKCLITVSNGSFQKSFEVSVSRHSQSISWAQEVLDVQKGDEIQLTATSSSGLDVEYTVIIGDASVADSKLKINASGKIEVEATQAGNEKYLPAVPVRKAFNAMSGVDLVFADEYKVRLDGCELIIGKGDYALYNLQGICIEYGAAPTRISLQPNSAYILRIGNKTVKLIVH